MSALNFDYRNIPRGIKFSFFEMLVNKGNAYQPTLSRNPSNGLLTEGMQAGSKIQNLALFAYGQI